MLSVMTYTYDDVNQERYWPKVRKTDSCWLWTAGHDADGYGRFSVSQRPQAAHRVAYILAHGHIPEGMQLDHTCRVRDCVNPAHLEPVTSGENTARGMLNLDVTGICRAGLHEIRGEQDIYVKPSTGDRYCVECKRKRDREWKRANRRSRAGR